MNIQVRILQNFMGDSVRIQNVDSDKPVLLKMSELRFLLGVCEGTGELSHTSWSVKASGEVTVKNKKNPTYCVTFQKEEILPLIPDEERVR